MLAVKKLPLEVQSKFRALVQIRTFKTAVEELVYNALDANSSSIAIRVHIQENYIQVVDNGCGIASDDFGILGQRHATSKFENPSSSKSIQKYGCYGQSLANLVEVSQSVKITSKCMKSAETWMKHFCNGQEEECSSITDRPSVGTTVEIKGFLYNLPIHKKAVKSLQQLENIKTFLEHMSLVHCNTSISLRDNSENEIIFKTHKNRDIIQTLASVLNIETCNLQEYKVEKNQYKVTGFIKNNYEESRGYQWIFVNERFIGNSKLHKIVNENLAAGVALKDKVKAKSYNFEDEKVTSNYELPDYFLFINCPRNDYGVISNPKQSIVELNNLPQINKLLDKLMKFHKGDINLVNTANTKEQTITLENDQGHETGTRNKVKQIIHKILGSQQRKMNGSNLHNGVKGKKIRRKAKTKVISSSNTKLNVLKKEDNKMIQEKKYVLEDSIKFKNHTPPNNNVVNVVIDNDTAASIRVLRNKQTENLLANINQEQNPLIYEKHQHVEEDISKKKNKYINKNPLSNFEKETDEVQKRCNILAKRVDHLLGVKKKRKCKVFTNETVHYSKIVRDNKSISIRKQINEMIIHEYLPLSHKNIAKTSVNILPKIKTSNDLIQPVMNIFNQTNIFKIPDNAMSAKMVQPQSDPCGMHVTEAVDSKIPAATFESHGYLQETQITQQKESFVERYKMRQFISKFSRDNFASPNKKRNIITDNKVVNKQNVPKKLYHNKMYNGVFTDVEQSSYSIHFTKTDTRESELGENVLNATDDISLSDKLNIGNTYTVVNSDKSGSSCSSCPNRSCILDKPGNLEANWNATTNVNPTNGESPYIQKTQKETETVARLDNVIFISNSHTSITGSNDIEPLEICETVISSHDERDFEEFAFIFDSINNVIERKNPNTIRTRQTCQTACETQRYANSNGRKREEDVYLNANFQKLIGISRLGNNNDSNNFNLKNRRRFIPKGMSPLFENCNLKSVCDYEFNEDYFEDTVYDNFVQNVQIHSEVFEPKIQNLKDTATRDIQRVDDKLNKDNACFTFNGESLKHAKVLRQLDNKFIATIIKGNSNSANDCFVLFDQHAVHERIRLEHNMSEYITHNQWKSVPLDGVSLKLTKDEILYLHNHKDKFHRLGLQWSIAGDSRVLVNAIPEAILGKHPRQVEVVLKSVKNLIKEEINIIKEQGGCVSLYPKSIMDLVFSEACRYAIMFGDALSVRECASLVEALSRCQTPFQCAHGRPAMAVLLDVARETRPYTVNFAGVKQFRRKLNKFNK